jgi:vitamin B12 transporter
MKKKYLKGLVLLSLLLMGNGMAMAEENTAAEDQEMSFDLEGVTVEAKRPDWEKKLSPGTVTIVRPDDYKGEQKTLPDLLLRVPGVHVREVNGKGQYTTVTIRGSTAAQVGVFIDGVMTNLGGESAVDLSTIPVKNVERVEVYRGYIPSRFGGTFIGGVINIVTKKPEQEHVSAEVGRSSYGGDKESVEFTAPLGSGSLMFGLNYEDSRGDFKYKNYAARRAVPQMAGNVESAQASLENIMKAGADWNNSNIDHLVSTGDATLSADEVSRYKADNNAWVNYVKSGGLEKNMVDTAVARGAGEIQSYDVGNWLLDSNLRDTYLNRLEEAMGDDFDRRAVSRNLSKYAYADFMSNQYTNFFDENNRKEQVVEAHDKKSIEAARAGASNYDPDKSSEYKNIKNQTEAAKKNLENRKKLLKAYQDANRHRRYNDRKNWDTILKWQNKNWTVKGAWTYLKRHLPDSVWGGGGAGSDADAIAFVPVDTFAIYPAESRRQTIDNKELLLENRHQNGNLDWGWRFDYLHQAKKYRAEEMFHNLAFDNLYWKFYPLREWSKYTSNKYNIQTDGTYKLGTRQMLDYQMNYSHEKLDVKGSNMDKVLSDMVSGVMSEMRNRYEQDIFNFQLQDSISLDQGGTFILTPSVRYNRSKITGYSDSKRFGKDHLQHFSWINAKDSQTDDKWTWQLALRKDFNDRFALRATGGTYYRLLNMYEIAGDGAGILPRPSHHGNTIEAMFPQPEEGKQFDISALWRGKLFNSDNSTTLTYFWRDSKRMLQLYRCGWDYWSYFNDNKGKSHGIEFQSSFKWPKFAIDLEWTHTLSHIQRKNDSVGYGYTDVWATYQPENEANVRFTWSPNDKISIFDEFHYTDEYFTYYGKIAGDSHKSYLSGRPVPSLTVMNAGIKWKPEKSWQITVGCNDIFNKGPKQKIWTHTAYYPDGDVSLDYPIQGRTWYATVRYEF